MDVIYRKAIKQHSMTSNELEQYGKILQKKTTKELEEIYKGDTNEEKINSRIRTTHHRNHRK